MTIGVTDHRTIQRARALVVDPGKITGYGFLTWGSQEFPTFHGGELPEEQFLDFIYPTLYRGGSTTHVICEGFKITARTPQTNPTHRELWSVQQLGILKLWCRWGNIPFFDPFPSAKNFDKDGTKLRKLGWWDPAPGVKGEAGHRRDAARHALKWGVDHRIIPLEALL